VGAGEVDAAGTQALGEDGVYSHAKQFRRERRTVKRQGTILGIVRREIKRKLTVATCDSPDTTEHLNCLLERAERIRREQPKEKKILCALHVPEVECIGKGKARKPC